MIEVSVRLVDGIDQNAFIDSFSSNDSVELNNALLNIPNSVIMNVEESYIETLNSDSRVIQAIRSDDELIEVSLPTLHTVNARVVTEESLVPYSSGNGHHLMGLQFYTDNDTMPPPTQNVGNHPDDDVSTLDDVDWSSHFLGRGVDIVSLEAGNPSGANDGHLNHPDFLKMGTTDSRFIPTDWPNQGQLTTNFQETNNMTFLSDHAIGVLSVAAGSNCGFAKEANMYVYYALNTAASITGLNNIIEWHNNKTNPNHADYTGNATILISEYQTSNQKKYFIPLDSVSEFRDMDGNTTNRPTGGWGNDLSLFVDNGVIPFKIEDPENAGTWLWTLTSGIGMDGSTLKDANEAAWDAGIVTIHAAGNAGEVYSKRDDASADNVRVRIDPGARYFDSNFAAGGFVGSYFERTAPGAVALDFRTHRSYGPHGCRRDKSIDVAAGQNSMASPALDGYTTRGPGIDIVGTGSDTFASGPQAAGATFGDGQYGYFGGTSCAAPTVVGKAACIMEEFKYNNGRWPTPIEVKNILISKAQDIVVGGESIDWSSTPTADGSLVTSSYMEFPSQSLIRTFDNNAWNGGYQFTDLCGTTTKRAFYSGKGFDRSQSQGRRPVSGAVYPRPRR